MKLRCVKCNKVVSDEIPDGTKVKAWIECRECVNAEMFAKYVRFDSFTLNNIRLKATKFYALCDDAELDFNEVDKIFNNARKHIESSSLSTEQFAKILSEDVEHDKLAL